MRDTQPDPSRRAVLLSWLTQHPNSTTADAVTAVFGHLPDAEFTTRCATARQWIKRARDAGMDVGFAEGRGPTPRPRIPAAPIAADPTPESGPALSGERDELEAIVRDHLDGYAVPRILAFVVRELVRDDSRGLAQGFVDEALRRVVAMGADLVEWTRDGGTDHAA